MTRCLTVEQVEAYRRDRGQIVAVISEMTATGPTARVRLVPNRA